MHEPSIHALVCDWIGEEEGGAPTRPTVSEALARLDPGSVVGARHRGNKVAVAVLDDGRAFVVPDMCPHGNALLSAGFVEGEALICPRHGWAFDLPSGTCQGRPAVRVEARALLPRK